MGAFLNDLAMLRLEQGRNEESIDLQQKSIRVLEVALGQGHPSLVVPFNNLATTYMKVGRFDEASLTYQRAIDICRKSLGEDHLDYAVLLENYAVALRKFGRKREANKAGAEGRQIERAVHRHNGVGLTVGVSPFAPTLLFAEATESTVSRTPKTISSPKNKALLYNHCPQSANQSPLAVLKAGRSGALNSHWGKLQHWRSCPPTPFPANFTMAIR